MDAISEQRGDAISLSRILFDILGVRLETEILVLYDLPTAYNVDKNIIVIKSPFSLCDWDSVISLAHECFHCFDFSSKTHKETYSSTDRVIINTKCAEYAYKYDFEKDATVFAYIFANYFFNKIVGYSVAEKMPSISDTAKRKYPELIADESKMILNYLERKDYYLGLISTFELQLTNCYMHFIDDNDER